jgi:hypothetical protein
MLAVAAFEALEAMVYTRLGIDAATTALRQGFGAYNDAQGSLAELLWVACVGAASTGVWRVQAGFAVTGVVVTVAETVFAHAALRRAALIVSAGDGAGGAVLRSVERLAQPIAVTVVEAVLTLAVAFDAELVDAAGAIACTAVARVVRRVDASAVAVSLCLGADAFAVEADQVGRASMVADRTVLLGAQLGFTADGFGAIGPTIHTLTFAVDTALMCCALVATFAAVFLGQLCETETVTENELRRAAIAPYTPSQAIIMEAFGALRERHTPSISSIMLTGWADGGDGIQVLVAVEVFDAVEVFELDGVVLSALEGHARRQSKTEAKSSKQFEAATHDASSVGEKGMTRACGRAEEAPSHSRERGDRFHPNEALDASQLSRKGFHTYALRACRRFLLPGRELAEQSAG